MEFISKHELNELLEAESTIQSFIQESSIEGNEFFELEEFVNEFLEQDVTV